MCKSDLRIAKWLTAVLFLIALATQAFIHFPRTELGAPYEEWDEISSSNGAAVLAAPETYRAYTYGSLDQLLHMIALFYQDKFDDLGKRTVRHSFSNSVVPSLSDPYLPFGPKTWEGLDYNYFRGLNDRHAIFVARKLYFGLYYLLLAGLGVWLTTWLGGAAIPLLLALFAFSTSALTLHQAILALPNAVNAVIAVIVALLSAKAIQTGRCSSLLWAAGWLAVAVNFKIDALNMLPLVALALSVVLFRGERGWASRVGDIVCFLRCAAVFLGVLLITQPLLLVHPRQRLRVQWDAVTPLVASSVDKASNWQQFEKFLAQDFLSPGFMQLGGVLSAWIALGIIMALVLVLTFRHQQREVVVDAKAGQWSVLLLLVGVLVLWGVPILRSHTLYDRYFLSGALVAYCGLLMPLCFAARANLVRSIVLVLCSVFVIGRAYWFAGQLREFARLYASNDWIAPHQARNQAVREMVKLIDQGGYAREVLIDQHSYTDLRYFWEHKISTRYINVFNYRQQLEDTQDRRELILFVPGDANWGDYTTLYPEYEAKLLSLPIVTDVAGRRMESASAAPVNAYDRVVVLATN